MITSEQQQHIDEINKETALLLDKYKRHVLKRMKEVLNSDLMLAMMHSDILSVSPNKIARDLLVGIIMNEGEQAKVLVDLHSSPNWMNE